MKFNIYSISIAMQVAGAILLLVFSIPTSRKKVVKAFFNNSFSLGDSEKNKLIYNHSEFKNHYKSMILSLLSALYIILGYFISIFIDKSNKSFCNDSIMIMLLIITFIFIGYVLASLIANLSHVVNRKVTAEELRKYGIEPNMKTTTISEIDQLFSNNKK